LPPCRISLEAIEKELIRLEPDASCQVPGYKPENVDLPHGKVWPARERRRAHQGAVGGMLLAGRRKPHFAGLPPVSRTLPVTVALWPIWDRRTVRRRRPVGFSQLNSVNCLW
jgi:hypothetical protein